HSPCAHAARAHPPCAHAARVHAGSIRAARSAAERRRKQYILEHACLDIHADRVVGLVVGPDAQAVGEVEVGCREAGKSSRTGRASGTERAEILRDKLSVSVHKKYYGPWEVVVASLKTKAVYPCKPAVLQLIFKEPVLSVSVCRARSAA